MIATLHIKNIGIIDEIMVEFNDGFNVLTGETGAGKSLIIKSIDVLCGGRMSKEMIRKDETSALVEACIFDKSLVKDVVVSREIFKTGRNLCKIDGRLVSVSELKVFMKGIVDIHGQYDNQTLLDEKEHIKLVDDFAKEELCLLVNEYNINYKKYNEIKSELRKNYGDDIEKQRKLDLLNYQLKEIEDANLTSNEEEQLLEQKKILQNSEKIKENLNLAEYKLSNEVIENLDEIIASLGKISHFGQNYSDQLTQVQEAYYLLTDCYNNIYECKENVEFNDELNNDIQNRLDLIFSLKRKYGNTIEEILAYSNKVRHQIEEIENLEEYTNNLKLELNLVKDKMIVLGKKIHIIREKYCKLLENEINKHLQTLEMKNTRFLVNIVCNEELLKEDGLDSIEFMVSTNIGEDIKPLSKVASGGELARIMLSIKTVLSKVDKIPVLVFDEIDTGISGIAVKSVASKIKTISKSHQVFVVTHQPILAAVADYNYKIKKSVSDGKTTTSIKLLDEAEIVEEIAQISNGSITKVALEHAMELRGQRAC